MARVDRLSRNEYMREYAVTSRERIYDILGDKCAICGITDKRLLDVDHIEGLAGRRNRAAWMVLGEVRRNPSGFRILCKNCNWLEYLNRVRP